MLIVSNLTAGYAGSTVLKGIDLTVAHGELAAVIGPNGAGKSTLLKTISGLVRCRSGTIRFDGEDLQRLRPDQIVQRGIVHVPEGRRILGRMSVRENLLLGAHGRARRSGPSRTLDEALALFPQLVGRLDGLAGGLSGGEQQMLAIARGLMAEPRLLMLDEPSLGIAPLVVESIFRMLDDIRRRGITILLVEQNAAKALASADRGYVLDLGEVAAAGGSRDLLSDARVRRAYLGA